MYGKFACDVHGDFSRHRCQEVKMSTKLNIIKALVIYKIDLYTLFIFSWSKSKSSSCRWHDIYFFGVFKFVCVCKVISVKEPLAVFNGR